MTIDLVRKIFPSYIKFHEIIFGCLRKKPYKTLSSTINAWQWLITLWMSEIKVKEKFEPVIYPIITLALDTSIKQILKKVQRQKV